MSKRCDGYHVSGRPYVEHVCSTLLVQGVDWSLDLGHDRQRRPQIYGLGGVHNFTSLDF